MKNHRPLSTTKRVVWVSASLLSVVGAVALIAHHHTSTIAKPAVGLCQETHVARIGGPTADGARYGLAYKAQVCAEAQCTTLVELNGELHVQAAVGAAVGAETAIVTILGQAHASDTDTTLPTPAALATPMNVRFSAQGNLSEVRYQRQVDLSTQRLLESVLRELQVVTPVCPVLVTAWTSAEDLVLGRVMSHFDAPAGLASIHWTRERVLEWHEADGLFPLAERSPTLAASEHSAKLTADHWVERLTGHDDFALQAGSAADALHLQVDVSLTPIAGRHIAFGPVEVKTAGFASPTPHSEVADESRIGGHDLSSIRAELVRTKTVTDSSGPGRSRLFVAAAALFRRNPDAAKQAAALIRAGDPEKKFLLAALGDAGTAQSADLLKQLLGEAKSGSDLTAVLSSLGKVSVANPDVVDAMAAHFSDQHVGGIARLMTGALAYGTRDNSPDTSAKAAQVLLADYSPDKGVLERSDTLRALGNAGSSDALELATSAAGSASPLERAAAAQALRRIKSEAADRLLAKLCEDPSDFVRRSALDAALYRDPTEILGPVVERVVRLDPVDTVRREAIRVLVRWVDQVASARAALEWVAQNDPQPDLRKVASEGLTRFTN